MKHCFTVQQELDTTAGVAVGAYLDCEHYLHLHKSLTGDLEILRIEGRKITVRQTWRWFGLTLGHIKSGEYFPPGRFVITEVKPSPWWIPSIHHILDIGTNIEFAPVAERNTTLMTFNVELNMPFWLYPLRRRLQHMIEVMHDKQNQEDMDCIKYRAKLFGRGNIDAYLSPYQFLYHKDDYVKHFGAQKLNANLSQ